MEEKECLFKSKGFIVKETTISIIKATLISWVFDLWSWFPYMMVVIAIWFLGLLIYSET